VRISLAAAAVIFIAAHVATLPPTLEDLDSINFALGVREFDVARHQPHPPGYPIYVALGKLSMPVFAAFDTTGAEARALAFWSAVAGGLLVPALFLLFRALDGSERRAAWATALTIASPLVWFTALRPLSDITGLTAAVFAQALLIRAISGEGSSRALVVGAFVAGLAIGVRSQTFLLTLPLLALAVIRRGAVPAGRVRLVAIGAFVVGVLCWASPLVVVSGGLQVYLDALGQQGGEDFSGVVMFWNFPTLQVGLSALLHTFVSPWGSILLAGAVLVAACAGLLDLAGRARTVIIVAALWVPYTVFHLLFHETVTVRYALPLIPAVAWLVVRGVDRLASPALPLAVGLLAAWGLWLAVPAGIRYGASPAPVFRALDDLAATRASHPVAVASHRRFFTESRRARMWVREPSGAWLDAPRDFEWLQLTRAWRSRKTGPAWFFAEPRRTDLALIDAEGARIARYRWPFNATAFTGGARPNEFDVLVYTAPGWFLEEGWAVTPEVAGITAREGWGPHIKPSVGWIRRRDDQVEMLLGGRHLGGPGQPPVRVVATIDGRTVLDREVIPGFFHEHVTLAAGSLAGDSPYARLLVSAVAEAGETPPVSLEQFNLQSAGVPMVLFGDGWHEPEYKPETGRLWRWMSERAVLWVRPVGRDVTLRITAESPLRYFDEPPALRVTVGGESAGQLAPSDDFTWNVTLSAAALTAHEGRVVIESDKWFAPGGSSGTGDQRHLAVRVYSVALE
jgi:hypothetical protein